MAKLTLKTERAEIKTFGATVNPDGCGECVVKLAGVEYFTPDLGDAVETARCMAKRKQLNELERKAQEYTETLGVPCFVLDGRIAYYGPDGPEIFFGELVPVAVTAAPVKGGK